MSSGRVFPNFDLYQSVLQHPEVCFGLPELQRGKLETDLWGLPRVRSGGFALTYRVHDQTKSFAVRCFHRNISDRYLRYQAIQATLAKGQIKYFVPIHYAGKGIKVGKDWYPITIMPWVDGETFENYLFNRLNKPEEIAAICDQFVSCVDNLENSHIAHGDLSHQNILVSDGQLVLVDYDGVFVPTLRGKMSCEIGHSNFQHPARNFEIFDERMDRFSAIVIYLALKAITINPALWQKFEKSGDGLLFRKSDFINPYGSEILQELETYSSLRKMVYYFRKICLCDPRQIPSLSEFMQSKMPALARDEIYVSNSLDSMGEVAFDATKRYLFSNQLGKIITVVGRISDIHQGKTKDNHPHIYLNFGSWRAKGFTILLWDKGYAYFSELISNNELKVGSWVKVTGILTAYRRRPQIAIDSPFGLEILRSSEQASQLLGVPAFEAEKPEDQQMKLNLDTQPIIQLENPINPDVNRVRSYNKKKLDELDQILSKKISDLYK